MKLVIFNGSPREQRSNSSLIINAFLRGYSTRYPDSFTVYSLMNKEKYDDYISVCEKADAILFVFPLYVDSMPGIVKLFMETLCRQAHLERNIQISYIIHSGFPEGIHTSVLIPYLGKYTHRLGARYMGTIARGGSESLRINGSIMQERYLHSFYLVGKYYAENHCHDHDLTKKLQQPFRFNTVLRFIVKIMYLTGFLNRYWNRQLKQNHAFRDRNDHPYSP